MANPIDLLESKIKEIVEGSAALFPWMDGQALSARRLVEAFQTYIHQRPEERGGSPAAFRITMNPTELARWTSQPDWEGAIVHTLTDTARELGQKLDRPFSIQLIPNPSLALSEIQIEPDFKIGEAGLTHAVPIEPGNLQVRNQPGLSVHAELILEDERAYPLTRTVTNIGRRSTNHLVLNDLRVSRMHAQIRYVNNEFIIFDIGSSGGTFINGERIQQHHLRCGDVISLAGVKLIFVTEETEGNTKPGGSLNNTHELQVQDNS